uniref:Uncharacterized protein n=1 Tax=Rhodnius prolixus TaxID=13249 RepID=T1HZI6_RHOPR
MSEGAPLRALLRWLSIGLLPFFGPIQDLLLMLILQSRA